MELTLGPGDGTRAIDEVGAGMVRDLNADALMDRGGHVELAAAIADRDADAAVKLAYVQLSTLVDPFGSAS